MKVKNIQTSPENIYFSEGIKLFILHKYLSFHFICKTSSYKLKTEYAMEKYASLFINEENNFKLFISTQISQNVFLVIYEVS